MNKKNIILTFIFIILVLGVGVFCYFKLGKINDNNDNKDNNDNQVVDNQNKFDGIRLEDATYKVTYEKKDNIIYFYKDGIEVNKYVCERSVCDTTGETYGGSVQLNNTYVNKIVIYDGSLADSTSTEDKKIVFFDIDKGILNTYVNYYTVYNISDSYIYMGKIGYKTDALIVNYSGDIIKNSKDKNFVLNCYEGCFLNTNSFDIDNDYIVTIKSDKYGIEKITNDEVILDNIYEDIVFNDYDKFMSYSYDADEKVDNNGKTYYEKFKYIKLKLNNKWYLYDLVNKKNVINNSYDEIILISDKVIMIYDNNEIFFVNYNGEKIDDNVIKTNKLNPAFAKPKFEELFSIRVKDNILDFRICDGEIKERYECYNNNLVKNYRYDINNKKLELISE